MSTRIQLRRNTAAQWKIDNPILALSEPGFETDTGIIRVGDGETPFVDLKPTYANGTINVIVLEEEKWTGDTAPYTQTIDVDLMTTEFNPNVSLIPSTSYNVALVEIEEYTKLYKGVSNDGSITFYATEKPKCDLSLRVKRL